MDEKRPTSSAESSLSSASPAGTPAASLAPHLEEKCRHCRQATAAAAHDLRTPLAILSGYVDLLATTKLGLLNPRQDAVLKEMSESIACMRRFTDEFLTYYSVQAGVELQLEESDLNQCIADVCRMWAPQFAKKAVAFYWLPGEGLPAVAFDYHKIQHIVSNLLDNALKFTPEGGNVWVHTEDYFWERRLRQETCYGNERRRSRPPRLNCARINVSDTGPGIAPDNLQEIFEEFRQIYADEGKPRGMGLGLAIAKRLAEMHRGKIWVESEVGHGSKFSVVLPMGPHKAGDK
jgi:signal transduction histidine kinase